MQFADYSRIVKWASVVCPKSQIVFVMTPKVACTTTKWALAELEGSLVPGAVSLYGESTRDQGIHDGKVNGLRPLGMLDQGTREAVLADPAWVRFCLTRSPYPRLLSAWVNRVLFRPIGATALGQLSGVELDPDVSVPAEGPVDVAQGFRAFVRSLEGENRELLKDGHFEPQVDFLDLDTFPYTHVLDLSGLDAFVEGLRASHPSRTSLRLGPPRNVSPSYPIGSMYDEQTIAVVNRLYARDIARFGYAEPTLTPNAPPVTVSRNEVLLYQGIRDRTERVLDLVGLERGTPARLGIRGASRALATALKARLSHDIAAAAQRYRGSR